MNRIHLLLLWLLLTSCGGLHRINRPPQFTQLKNNTCETLFKKQRHQYNIAVREAKGRQRWSKNALLAETKIDPRRNTSTVANFPSEHIGSSVAPEIPTSFRLYKKKAKLGLHFRQDCMHLALPLKILGRRT